MEMTNDLAASNHVELSTMECSHAEEGDNDEGESFELETGFDDEHFVLCNKRVDYQLRSPVLQHISLYFFFAEYRKAKMTLHDKTLLGLLDQSTTGIPRGRPPNDRWLFHCDHPQYSTHITIRRSFAVIPVLVGPAIPRCDREDTAQRYARAILTLFHPWTTVLDLCHLNQSWIEALTVLQTTFSTQSNRVISNIQLLHECKRDRDNDLFQLVNKSTTVTNETSFFEPYLATGVGDVEEILTLLDTSIDPNSSFANQNVNEFNSAQARIKSEYLDSTIANVIRSGRFSHIPTNESLSELMSNNPHVFSNRTTANELIVRKASESDVQQNRAWQHALKTQKERMRQILLFGLTDEQMTVNQTLVRQN